ncbi:ABC transporter permease [Bifidobacterium pseudolongum]|nr:ABC transporter permease [Bifidobacterium pseudolongum]
MSWKGFVRFSGRRALSAIMELLVLSIVVFFIVRLIPGDPAAGFFSANTQPTPEQLEELRTKLGLNLPWYQQYFQWIGGVASGDFGASITTPFPVGSQIAARLPYSVELALLASVFAMVFGVLLGFVSGTHPDGWQDGLSRSVAFVFLSVPSFIVAVALLLLNSRGPKLKLIGATPFLADPLANLGQMLLPALVLALGLGAYISRYTRSSLVEDASRPYVRTLRSVGTSPKAISWFSLRNAMIPVSTVMAVELASLVGGTVVIEQVFSIPGMGTYLINAIKQHDYPAIQGSIFVIGAVYVVLNLVVDLLYPVIDPRVRVAQ